MKRFIKEYKIELITTGLALIGVFLVLERSEILASVKKGIDAIWSTLEQILTGASKRAELITASDALGGLMILLAVGFIIWRIRYRFNTSKRWALDYCPKCSGPIMRVHRNFGDRILGAIFTPEARRYRCADAKCGWSGLLSRHVHHQRRRSKPVPGS